MNRLSFVNVLLITFVTLVSSPARAGSKPSSAQERSAAFVAEGDTSFEQGDYEEAIIKYRAAYYGLTPEQRTSYLGSIPVRNAMSAYDLLLAERQDRRVLEQQLGFLTEFLESVRGTEGGVALVGEDIFAQMEQTRTEAEQKLAALAQAVAPPPDPEEEQEVQDPAPPPRVIEVTSTEKSPEVPDDWSAPSPLRKIGLGLAIGGGSTAGIGAGVMVGWWTVRNRALVQAEQEWGADLDSPNRQRYLMDQWYRARRHLIAGGVLLGVGAAAATVGTLLILWPRIRGRTPALTLGPRFGSDGAGLQVTGRF